MGRTDVINKLIYFVSLVYFIVMKIFATLGMRNWECEALIYILYLSINIITIIKKDMNNEVHS